MLNIKILGSGCANCKRLEAMTREVAGTQGAGNFPKSTDHNDICSIQSWRHLPGSKRTAGSAGESPARPNRRLLKQAA